MRFVTISADGERAGVLSADGSRVVLLEELGFSFSSLQELIEGYTSQVQADLRSRLAGAKGGIPLEQAKLLAPLPRPLHDLICVGMNYTAHAKEVAEFEGKPYQKPEYAVYFSKRVYEAVAPEGKIPSHSHITEKLDYECELAVVIGRTCSRVSREEAFDYIFGYTIVNDVSAREIQKRHSQFYLGKSLDGFTPMGPWIVTPDELPEPGRMNLRSRVNGELRQDSNTADFIFDIPHLISELSQGITLQPGDILITGTPSGVGMGYDPPRYLRPGDVVECEVEGIGTLRNRVE